MRILHKRGRNVLSVLGRALVNDPKGSFAWVLFFAGAALCFISGMIYDEGGGRLFEAAFAAAGVVSLLVWFRILSNARERALTASCHTNLEFQRSEKLLRLITDNMDDLITVADTEGCRLYTSPSYERILGYSMVEAQNVPLAALVHPEDWPDLQEAHGSTLATREVTVVEVRIRQKTGRWRSFECTVTLVRANDGRPCLLTVGRDITDRQLAWEAVKDSQTLLQSLVDSLPQNILRKDINGRFTFANSQFASSVGKPLPQIIGRLDSDLFPGHLAAKYREDDLQVMSQAAPVELVEVHRTADGRNLYVQVVKTPLIGPGGGVEGLQVMFWDVTEREEAQRSLRRSYLETESLMASISAVLIGVDLEGRVNRWNRSAEIMFGIPAEEAIGRSFSGCRVQWDWRAVRQAAIDCRIHRKTVELENVVCHRPDRKDAVLHLFFSPDTATADQNLQFTLLATDTTERRMMENQLRQAQKLESIGQLAAGIAHEINTPTQFIGDNLRFLRDTFVEMAPIFAHLLALAPNEEESPEVFKQLDRLRNVSSKAELAYLCEEIPLAIGQALEGVDRVAGIVRAMKEFSHPNAAQRTLINLNRAVEGTATVARNEWKYVAELVMELDPDLPPISCFPGDVNQVILNLIVNAAHAIGETPIVKAGGKGVLTLGTRRVNDAVELRVKDSGNGIPETIRGKIFDPFFTTKGVGKGSGQGLFLAHNVVVEKHGGDIRFETETGVGTTFFVRLPLQAKQPVQMAA